MRGTRLEAAVLSAVLTIFAFLLTAGHNRWSGDEILRVTARHGVNGGDSLVLGLWLIGMATVWRIGLSDEDQRGIVVFVTRAAPEAVGLLRRRRSAALLVLRAEATRRITQADTAFERHRRAVISFLETARPPTVVLRQSNDDAGRTRRDPRDL